MQTLSKHLRRANPRIRSAKAQGFSLVEVLIAIVVLSFGLLGVAGMQIISVKNVYSSKQRSLATQLAQDLADRVRANMGDLKDPIHPDDRTRSAYHKPATTPYSTARSAGCVARNASDQGEGLCAWGEMAADDLAEWQSQIENLLGSAAGIICLDQSENLGLFDGTSIDPQCSGSGDRYVIKIWWMDDRSKSAQGASAYQAVAYRFTPERVQ